MQAVIVGMIVAGCAVHAAWRLMPPSLRRLLAAALLKLSWPERLARPLRLAARPAAGCGGCDGCAGTVAPSAPKPVTLQRRPRRR
ncbi:MAG TPA: DUF6587 family protein [Albitalea sp.]|jgi:hypothetical protein|nr:DUF6587 family protein [Albitalea sp.]